VSKRLLGLGSFDNLERPLAYKQVFFPITFDGIRFIPMATFAPTTYLGSRALVASIIAIRFMVDQCPFLFETLAQMNNNTFPFQQHLKAACDFLSPPSRTYLLSFEQFIGQQTVQLQDSILEHLHHHIF